MIESKPQFGLKIKALSARLTGGKELVGGAIAGYTFMGMNILMQVLYVPIYLKYLGKFEFGVLMLLLSFFNYASMGIVWMSGGMQRILGECAAVGDEEGFTRAYSLCKTVNCLYAALIALAMVLVGTVGLNVFFPGTPIEHRMSIQYSVIAAAIYFVVLYEFNVERLALAARQELVVGYLFQILSLVTFAIPVVFCLRAGGGLKSILICLLLGVISARVCSWIFWRKRGVIVVWRLPDRESIPMLKRLTGKMGRGFMLYGPILLTIQADMLMVGKLGGALAAAQFALVWRIADALIQVFWKIPELIQPYIVQMDTRGEHGRLTKIYRRANILMQVLPLAAGIGYALGGYWLVRLWVGPAHAPYNPMGYALAGAAIFWMSSARLPSVYAFAKVEMRKLNTIAGVEMVGKLLLTIILFPRVSYLAPLIATRVMHAGGIAIAYRRMVRL